MWMSDKPLVQEELTEDLGSLIHCFPDIKVGVQFFRNFLETMCLEWFGIDQWRIDKFMMVSDLDDFHLEKCFQDFFSLAAVGAPRHPPDVGSAEECRVGG
jgi:hypothetical protein